MEVRWRSAALAGMAIFMATTGLRACPFCNVESQTLTEETKSADAVVLAKLLKEAPTTTEPADPNSGMATFQIAEVLKGQETLGETKEIQVVFFGDANREKTYLITGLGKEKLDWTTPLPLAAEAVAYVKKLPSIPPAGAGRLEFFQDFLENADPLLAQDAYDEFARAPYADVKDLKAKLHHDRLIKWVADPEVSPSRRRLYLTMLGVCGTKDDVPLLEAMIVSDFEALKPALVGLVGTGLSLGGPVGMPVVIEAVQQDERRKKLGLDALVACYLILRGPDGLELVENRFLKNSQAEYTHIYSTIMALRFHGDENTGILPRERLLASMRLLLDNVDFADQVVLDLSRWEDWSVLDRLVEMFKNSDAKGYVRQPVVSYLTVASEQPGDVGTKAKAALAELEKLDPETVKTARSLMAFGALGRARGAASAASAANSASAGTATDSSAATAAAAQAFAASPSDEKTDTSQIPDPATFAAQPAGTASKAAATAASADAGVKPASESKSSAPAAATAAEAKPATASAAAAPTAASPGTSAGSSAEPTMNPLLVAGVPIIAAVVLMGIYWLVLRAGAM